MDIDIEGDLKDLDVLQISILFWRMRGLSDKEIGKKFGFGDAWTEQRMGEIYKELGFDPKMHSKRKSAILGRDYLPVVKLLTNDDPDTLSGWPLKAKKLPKTIDQTKPEKGRVDQIEPGTGPVDRTRRPNDPGKTAVAPARTRNPLLIPMGILTVCLISFIGLAGFALAKGYVKIPGFSPLTSPLIPPAPTLPSGAPESPTQALATSDPTQASNPTAAQQESSSFPTSQPTRPIPTATLTPTDAPTPTAFIPPSDGILFQDNFDNGISPEWEIVTGTWITSNGKMTIAHEGNSAFVWIRIGNPSWQNYHIQMDVDRSRQRLIIAVRDQSIGYWDSIYGQNCWTSDMDISYDASCITGLAKEAPEVIQLDLEINGNEFTALVNGLEVQTLTYNGSTIGGVAIGIQCGSGPTCSTIDNLKITYLP